MAISLALLFGGKSAEHEVSVRSARNIYTALDKDKYAITLIGIDRKGRWYHIAPNDFLEDTFTVVSRGRRLATVPGESRFIYLDEKSTFPHIDVVFPITHGPNGEDGTLQGLLRQIGLPFVGPDVMGSAVSMDKDMCKRVLREAGIQVAQGYVFHLHEKDAIDYMAVVNRLGSPVFVKPANMGSSVGVAKAENAEEFYAAIQKAFEFDRKILVEEMLVGRELECAVMGNATPETTSVGEVGMAEGFYDYESKYVSDDAATISIPAPGISAPTHAKLLMVARQAFQVCGCEGLTRVDMFLCEGDEVYVNELNTLPGFTNISMYPKLWEHTGTGYADLLDHLVELALERATEIAGLKAAF